RAKEGRATGELAQARQRFEEAHEIRARLHREDEANPLWAIALSQSLVRIGDVKVDAEKNYSGARADYQRGLELTIEVLKREPAKVQWQRELSWGLFKVGDMLLREQQVAEGIVHYEQALCARR